MDGMNVVRDLVGVEKKVYLS